jgi:hypothetical protein
MNGFQNDTPHAEATVNTPMNCIAAKVKANMRLDWIMVFGGKANDLRARNRAPITSHLPTNQPFEL